MFCNDHITPQGPGQSLGMEKLIWLSQLISFQAKFLCIKTSEAKVKLKNLKKKKSLRSRNTENLKLFSTTWPALFSNGLLFFQLYVEFGVHRCFCLLFVFAFWLHPQHMEVPWVGLNLSLSCDLHHSCGNTGTLTHCARLGIQPVPLQWPELLQSDP